MARAKARDENDEGAAPKLPPPEAGAALIGHEAAEAAMKDAFAAGRMHHAWLIAGPRGIGKATLAFRLARHVLAQGGDEASVARQIVSGAAQDLMVIRKPVDEKTGAEKSVIPVDEIRRLQDFFALSAGAGGWRVAIVDSVDDMNASSANALLKILEEPPQKSLLLLVAHSLGRVLPTLRSRCRKLVLPPMPSGQLLEALPKLGEKLGLERLPQEDISVLVKLSSGCIGRALDLWVHDGLKIHHGLQEAFALWPRVPDNRVANLAAIADRAEGGQELLRDLLIALLQQAARAEALGAADSGAAASLATHAPGHVWAELAADLDAFFARGAGLYLDDKMLAAEALRRIAGVPRAASA